MNSFSIPVDIRWSDLDPNFHLRHSVYYDYGAYARIVYLEKQGLTTAFMQEHQFGPIIFREECVFRKELRLGDEVTIDLVVLKSRNDYSRWTIRHNIYKKDTVAAILTLDGAWLNTAIRKLTIPIEMVQSVFEAMPKAAEFEWIKT